MHMFIKNYEGLQQYLLSRYEFRWYHLSGMFVFETHVNIFSLTSFEENLKDPIVAWNELFYNLFLNCSVRF